MENNIGNLQNDITNLRDSLGLAALLISCNNTQFFEIMRRTDSEESADLDYISKEMGIDSYFLEPVLEILSDIGILTRAEGRFKSNLGNQSDYIKKMFNAFPLYLQLCTYLQKASGENVRIFPEFNQFITSASSRLAGPAIKNILKAYPSLADKNIKLLDVGCGIGEYLINFAKANPNLVGYGIEIDSEVAKKAALNVQKNGLEERIKVVNANFLDKDKEGVFDNANIVMMNHIYHVVGEDLSRSMTKKAYQHLREGGRFFNLEICKDYPLDNAIIPKLFDALMRFYYQQNKGKAFIREDIERIMCESGFKVNESDHIHLSEFDTPNMVYFVGVK